jgi:hypothetical protein
MNSKDYRKIGGLILLILFLLACVSSSGTSSAPTPLPEAKMRKTLEAMIAQTSAAAQTQTTTARPSTLTPTITRTPSKTPTQPTPSPTFFYSLFTATLDIKVESTDASLNATAQYLNSIGAIDLGGFVLTPIPIEKRNAKNQWRCFVRYSPSPSVAPEEKFDAYWTVVNTGWNYWTSNTVDFIHRGGFRHEGRRIQDIRSTVDYGRTLSIGATFIAPKAIGSYHSYYVLQVGNNAFCPMWMEFKVNK